MNVRGISVLTRKRIVVRRFGSESWAGFYRGVARAQPCFRSFITADSLVPLPAYLAFHDELMQRFFGVDEGSYFDMGRESSRYALTEGPLKGFVEGGDLTAFVAALPDLHQLYFQGASTWSEASITADGVDFKVFGLPHRHPYLEHFIVGYVAEALELFCANPIQSVRLRSADGEYHYLFRGTPAVVEPYGGAPELARCEPSKPPARAAALSSRELEVVQLVALGKTNEEIGTALHISKKTAQHHLAHAYRKLGVSGRVGATVWLARHGLVNPPRG